jgi:ribosomal protein S27E
MLIFRCTQCLSTVYSSIKVKLNYYKFLRKLILVFGKCDVYNCLLFFTILLYCGLTMFDLKSFKHAHLKFTFSFKFLTIFSKFISGCYKITTVFSHAQTVVLCVGCSTVLCQPTGGRARLTEGSF